MIRTSANSAVAGERAGQPAEQHARQDGRAGPCDDRAQGCGSAEACRYRCFIPLDAPPAFWPEQFPGWRFRDLRQTILHVIAETACHAGDLDAVPGLIDSRTWLILG